MIELNIKVLVSEEKYKELLINLKDVSNNDSKEYLEDYISSGLEYDIENNNSEFLFD
jgi:hypothetical protein